MFKQVSFDVVNRFKGSLLLKGSDSSFYLLSLRSGFNVGSDFICKSVRYLVKDRFDIDTGSFDFVTNFNAGFRGIIFDNYFTQYLDNAVFYLYRSDVLG